MAIIREHLAAKGLGLHNDLQNESSIVGNFPTVLMMRDFGTDEQQAEWMPGFLDGTRRLAFGLTEPNHGSDATYLETTAVRDGDEWVINGAEAVQLRAAPRHPRHRVRPHVGRAGLAGRHHRVPRADRRRRASASTSSGGRSTCRPTTPRSRCATCASAPTRVFGEVDHGLELAQHFVHENRIRQAASSLGAGAVLHRRGGRLRQRSASTWGKPLSRNQAHPVPARRAAHRGRDAAPAHPVHGRGRSTASHHMEVTHLVAMCNYRANRLACDAADRAMQTCGGVGYSRHMPFEHIYRHHRRYRITEGSEEIQMRKVGQQLFGFGRKPTP